MLFKWRENWSVAAPRSTEAEQALGQGSRLTARALVHQVHALLLPRPPTAVGSVQDTLVVVRPAVGAADRLVLRRAVLAAAAALDVER